MATRNASVRDQPRISDRLAAARRGRMVGRQAELDLFRSALAASEPPFAVLHIYGPGGIGKTMLLQEYGRLAAERGRPVVYLDGRNTDSSPEGFLFALRQALGQTDEVRSPTLADWPRSAILLIDTYETLSSLDVWLRESFLPGLCSGSLIVIAGRNPPDPAWRTDVAWATLTQFISLHNLCREESEAFLLARGIPGDQHAEALAFTHGHPLALVLVADVLRQGDGLAAFNPHSEPDVVRVLLERLVRDTPDAERRLALDVCTLAWATTETLLAGLLPGTDAHAMFEWLCRLSFIEYGSYGVFPHDLAREVLSADLRWRNPGGHQRLVQQLCAYFYARFQAARGVEQQRIWSDLLHLNRHNPYFQPYFEWAELGTAYAEPAAPRDYPAVLALVERHQGQAAALIARYWLDRQPNAFLAYRDRDGTLLGFMAHLTLREVTSEDAAADPAVQAALGFTRRYGPVRTGEEIAYLRFWMHHEAYQRVSPAVNMTAINSSIFWTTHPRLAWNFIAIADPDFFGPHFTSIHMWRSPEADFEVGGQTYGVFAHDWRVEPVADWMSVKFEAASDAGPAQEPRRSVSARAVQVLSQPEFGAAVRQALRDVTRPERLAQNQLLASRLVADRVGSEPPPAVLQRLLREAAANLTANPKDAKFHRAVWLTYFEPALTQGQAAEQLGLPFNTYRYHLAKGIERITAWLWDRELSSTRYDPPAILA